MTEIRYYTCDGCKKEIRSGDETFFQVYVNKRTPNYEIGTNVTSIDLCSKCWEKFEKLFPKAIEENKG